MKRHQKILTRDKTALLLIDVQERILDVMMNKDSLIDNQLKLIKGFKILNTPIFFTEQYPKGLGPTINVLLEELKPLEAYQKITFSCIGAGNLFNDMKDKGIEKVVVCGIESHVCVMQTALDLIQNDFQVSIPVNAVSSRKKEDYDAALVRYDREGVIITSVEAVLFELLENSRSDEFKQISKLIK